ncbi:MAG TPA: sigma-54 dependent transcriptional regulator [Pirellulales bacterium]|nr:sigma-54 dependent transcriptional regulator [Pirellulales bacterium]
MPSVLVIDDDRSVLHIFKQIFKDTDVSVLSASAAEEGLSVLAEQKPDVVILDIMLPDQSGLEMFDQIYRHDSKVPVIFITAGGTSDTAIEAMKLGAYDYLLKPLDIVKVRALVERALEIRRYMHVPVRVPEAAASAQGGDDIFVGRCPAMQEVYKAIGRVAPHNVTVLIRGESGTGKELVARALYHHSPRSTGRYLAVNIAAVPETLLESELFGHEKGAFTGADSKRIGRFEQCSGGTLFLDEVGDMTPLVQSKLLRLLQEQKFERVGGSETIATDVRILAATNRDLEKMVADGEFRADLYYRLNGYSIKLPPLKERGDDLVILLEHFLTQFAKSLGKDVEGITPEALELLAKYPWPGNVRELQGVVRQALLHATGQVLLPDFLPEEVRCGAKAIASGPGRQSGLKPLESFIGEVLESGGEELYAESLAMLEKYLFTRVLNHTRGNQSQAAKILGITRGSLRNKIRLLKISIGQVVSVEEEEDAEEDHAAAPVAASADGA